ncbi:hypothetical protein Tco_0806186 [Tanacetum coccineum]
MSKLCLSIQVDHQLEESMVPIRLNQLDMWDDPLNRFEDESLDMIVDESLMVEDKSLEKLVDETLKHDEEHFESVIADKTITKASLRIHLKLEDNGGVTTLPNSEIFEQLALMLYATDSDKLTFQKDTAIICLATTRTFNFSKFIFDAMRLLQPHTRTYSTPVLTQKVFSNMKRVTKGYSGEDTPLFASMITASKTSPSKITSSPSLSPQHTPFTAPSTSQPSNIHTTPVTKEAASMPHESPL